MKTLILFTALILTDLAANAQTKSKTQKTTKAKTTVIKTTKATKEKISITSTPVVAPKKTKPSNVFNALQRR